MNNIDILVLAALFLFTTLYILYLYLPPGYSTVMAAFLFIVYSLPFAGFVVFLLYKLLKRIPSADSAKSFLSNMCICNKPSSKEVSENDYAKVDRDPVEDDPDQPYHMVDDYLNTYM